jgi:hypothetical protein
MNVTLTLEEGSTGAKTYVGDIEQYLIICWCFENCELLWRMFGHKKVKKWHGGKYIRRGFIIVCFNDHILLRRSFEGGRDRNTYGQLFNRQS